MPAPPPSRFTAARPSSPTPAWPIGNWSRAWPTISASRARQRRLRRAGARSSTRMRSGGQRRPRRPGRAAQPVDPRSGRGHRRGPCPARGHVGRAGSVPARVHRAAAGRARQRSRMVPARRAIGHGRRHASPLILPPGPSLPPARRERWVINKLRALCAWYSKGLDGGSHLRVRVNTATSISELRDIVTSPSSRHAPSRCRLPR